MTVNVMLWIQTRPKFQTRTNKMISAVNQMNPRRKMRVRCAFVYDALSKTNARARDDPLSLRPSFSSLSARQLEDLCAEVREDDHSKLKMADVCVCVPRIQSPCALTSLHPPSLNRAWTALCARALEGRATEYQYS